MRKLFLLLCLLTAVAPIVHAQELNYYGNDPYAALNVAQRERKLLLVEFYAPWNHRSQWMHEKILRDTTFRRTFDEHFILVQVLTETPDGATLARLYEVNDYPAIVIFNYNGDVLDKIDTTLDKEDFSHRIQTLLLALHGGQAWRMSQIFAAAEYGDRPAVDAFATSFLGSQTPEQIINAVVWPLFENSQVTYYYSATFHYLLEHLDEFRTELGVDKVDETVSDVLVAGMFPYLLGSVDYSPDLTADMIRIAREAELPAADVLRSMDETAALRGSGEYFPYVGRLSILINQLPESMILPLVLSLEVVAEHGTKEEKAEADRLLNRVISHPFTPTDFILLEALRERLK